jgi:hypothetical protein
MSVTLQERFFADAETLRLHLARQVFRRTATNRVPFSSY